MKLIKQLIAVATVALAVNAQAAAPANEAPDALVKRISQDVIDTAKSDKSIQAGDTKKVIELVETKILPYVDFQRMTALAAGRFWRDATPEQQKNLSEQFRTLLVFTYSGALSQIKNETVEFKPLRADPADTDVEVRSQVSSSRGFIVVTNDASVAPSSLATPLRRARSTASRPRPAVIATPKSVPARAVLVRTDGPWAR